MSNRRIESPVRAAGAAILVLALASCATLNREGSMAPLEGGSVSVRQGAPLVISLAPDPATGLGWVLTSKPGDAVWLVGGPDYTPAPVPEGMMGIGNTTTYRFRAKTPGTQTLEFAYRETPDMNTPPTRTARYEVTVISAGWQNWF